MIGIIILSQDLLVTVIISQPPKSFSHLPINCPRMSSSWTYSFQCNSLPTLILTPISLCLTYVLLVTVIISLLLSSLLLSSLLSPLLICPSLSHWGTCLEPSSWFLTRLSYLALSSCWATCSLEGSLPPHCRTGSNHSATSHQSATATMPSSNSTSDMECNSCES